MFEARLKKASTLKKLLDAMKDLVTDANFDVTSTGIALQAMDTSHVSLVALNLRKEGFDQFRCDRNISLGINLQSMAKIMKCAGNDDVVTMKAEDSGDSITFMFESEKQTRISHFSLKLMDIDSEHLGIPEQDYQCVVQMPANEFQRICREITIIGDTVKIAASKEGVKFSVSGDLGTGSIVCKQNAAVDEEDDSVIIKVEEEMSLTFALRYLNFFAKATPLAKAVKLSMSPDVPLAVEYKVSNEEEDGDMGQLQFFLAPKIEEDEGEGGAKDEAADREAASTEGGDGGED